MNECCTPIPDAQRVFAVYSPSHVRKVSERNFHRFLVRSGVESSLGADGACGLMERMDPRATGYILYNKFLDKVTPVAGGI